MLTALASLLFTIAIVASLYALWSTVTPRLPYMRALLMAGRGSQLPPLPAARLRNPARPALRPVTNRYHAAAA